MPLLHSKATTMDALLHVCIMEQKFEGKFFDKVDKIMVIYSFLANLFFQCAKILLIKIAGGSILS